MMVILAFCGSKHVEEVEKTTTNDEREEVKTINKKPYLQVNIYFQSTYLCNIISINAINKCDTTAMIRARG